MSEISFSRELDTILRGGILDGTLSNIKTHNSFIPIWDNYHWKLVMIHHDRGEIHTFDPTGTPFNLTTYSKLKHCFPTYTTLDMEIQLQTDNHSCGLWVVYMGKIWTTYLHSPTTHPIIELLTKDMRTCTPRIFFSYPQPTRLLQTQLLNNGEFIRNLRIQVEANSQPLPPNTSEHARSHDPQVTPV